MQAETTKKEEQHMQGSEASAQTAGRLPSVELGTSGKAQNAEFITPTRAQIIGMLVKSMQLGTTLECMALRADMVAKIARQELAARTAAGCIGVGLVITTHDMAGSDQPFAL